MYYVILEFDNVDAARYVADNAHTIATGPNTERGATYNSSFDSYREMEDHFQDEEE